MGCGHWAAQPILNQVCLGSEGAFCGLRYFVWRAATNLVAHASATCNVTVHVGMGNGGAGWQKTEKRAIWALTSGSVSWKSGSRVQDG